ncbi:DUF1302 family protein [Immundisolibacter sp.]|uniref:DUF1302 family protein n=1 Tax=Immundisolibacter sp. TaxID=1934948 RepID=UPI00356A140D
MHSQNVKTRGLAVRTSVWVVFGSAMLLSGLAQAVTFEYSGYIREHLSVNLQNSDEFENRSAIPAGVTGVALATPDGGYDTYGGKGELSMIRHSAKVEAKADFGAFQVFGVGRVARETKTSWERGLNKGSKTLPALATNGVGLTGFPVLNNPGATVPVGSIANPSQVFANASQFTSGFLNQLLDGLVPLPCALIANPANDCFAPGLLGFGGGTTDHELLDDYNSTSLREVLREFYVTFDVGDRYHFKLGKQQVVWGETDFFRAMDIIHGYDMRWRSFLELENEELRKPLILGNVTIDVPELAGALQLIYRPGWDGGHDIGDDAALNGGRWMPSPWGGAGVTSSMIGKYNYHHNKGDENDPNYGFRWSGTAKQIGYSFAYYHGLSTDGLVVTNPVVGGGNQYGDWESGPFQLSELIFPEIDTFGVTLNAYSGFLDAVIRGEMAYTPDRPYNTGTDTYVDLLAYVSEANTAAGSWFGAFWPSTAVLLNDPDRPVQTAYAPGQLATGAGLVGATLSVPGLGNVVEKDTLKIMVGMDKQLGWTMNWLKTSRPAFWTMQLFDTWVLNYDRDDDIVELFGFGAARREHQTFWTNAFSFPYRYDTVTPSLAFGFDLGSFDAFLLPALDIAMGDHWRLRFEADIFLPRHVEKTNLGMTGSDRNDGRLLSTLHDRDQFVARITYQF